MTYIISLFYTLFRINRYLFWNYYWITEI